MITGLLIGDGIDKALKFRIEVNGPGAYTFEAVDYPGYFLVIDDFKNNGVPFLAQVFGTSHRDPRFRFELFASAKDLKMNLFQFDPVMPLGSGIGLDSRVL